MEYARLGDTDISISRICLGTMTWGLQNSQSQAFEQMEYALDHGVNFWDTAEMYAIPPTADTYGSTEKIIGNWFSETKRRDEVILATKFSPVPWARGVEYAHASASSVRTGVEESLKRLRTDYIDLYQLHWPTNRPNCSGSQWWNYVPPQEEGIRDQIIVNMYEVLEALNALVQEGKIRTIGLSNDSAWGISQHIRLSELHNFPRIVSLQNEYSLLRRHIERNIAETCALEDISILAWSPLAMGIISGKYLDGARPEGSRFSHAVMGDQKHRFENRLAGKTEECVKALLQIADKHKLDVCQLAIKFTIRYPHLTSTIIGATTIDQLASNIAAIDLELNEDILSDLSILYHEFPVPF